MKREFLKLMGLDKLAINRIMAVYSADVERYKRELAQRGEQLRSLQNEASRWEAEANRLARELYYAQAGAGLCPIPGPEALPPSPHPEEWGAQLPLLPRQSEQDDRRKLD